MANFGCSVGDIVTVGSLAWNVYKACSNASSEFQEVAREVISLHAAVKELEEEASKPDSVIRRAVELKQRELQTLVRNIGQVLAQLERLVSKYRSLGTKNRNKRDVIRFSAEGLEDIRSKVIVHTSAVNLFLGSLSAASLGRIESKLDEIVKELQSGQRDTSAIALSDDEDDFTARQQWRALRKELVEDGFQQDDIDYHKAWIKAQMRKRIADGQDKPLMSGETTDQQTIWDSAAQAGPFRTSIPSKPIAKIPQLTDPCFHQPGECDLYGFPKLRRSPSVSSITSIHSDVSEHDSYGNLKKRTVTTTTTTHYSASATDDSAASDRDYISSPYKQSYEILPRPQGLLGNPPTPQPMIGQSSSKLSSSTQKKHKCKICGKRFTRPSSLQAHLYMHTGEKPFACNFEGCGRHFSVVSNLRRHRKMHKGETQDSDADSESELNGWYHER